jgi:hypothetical protein
MTANNTCPHCGADADDDSLYLCGTEEVLVGVFVRASGCYERQIGQLQARIDEIMFEHCPDEMTKEQIERYTNAQRIVEE